MKIFFQKNLYKLLLIFILLSKITSNEIEITIQGKTYEIKSPNVIDEDTEISDGVYETNSLEEPVFIVRGKSVLKLKSENIIIKKTIENSNSELDEEKRKLGLYSAILAIGSSTVEIEKAKLETNCDGCVAISVLEEAKLNFYDGNITTHKNYSPSIYLNFGGELLSDTITINTEGNYSPSILVLGESKITVANSYFYTKGENSPLFYSQGNSFISSSEGTSENSKIIISKLIDEKNKFVLNYCEFIGLYGVKIYKNTSLENCSGQFNMLESKLTLNNENSEYPMFEFIDSNLDVTLDTSEFDIKNEFLINAKCLDETNEVVVSVTVEGKTITGTVKTDSISHVNFKFNSNLSKNGIKSEGNVEL